MSTLDIRADSRSGDTDRSFGPWPLRGRGLAVIAAAFAVLVAFGWVVGTIVTSLASTSVGEFDRSVSRWFAAQRTDTLDLLSDIGSGFSDTLTVVVALVILVAVFLAVWRRWPEALMLVVALGLEVTTFVTIAFLVGRDRPPVEQLDPSPPTASFPSGHTAAAVALYLGLALIVTWNTENRLVRGMAWTVGILAPVAVALSRMYRGMHFITDVTAGALLGLVCLGVAVWALRADRVVEPRQPEEVR